MTRFAIAFAGGRAEVALPALGLHNVRNALTAFAVGVEAGVPAAVCVDALAGFVPSGSRQNVYEKNGLHIIADCYNASPESMTAALSVLRDFPGRRIAVLGDMLELGAHTDRLHRELGGAVREAADLLFTLGEAACCAALYNCFRRTATRRWRRRCGKRCAAGTQCCLRQAIGWT